MSKSGSCVHPIDAYAGKRLRLARSRQRISQADLAGSLPDPITFQQIQKYERGCNRMSVSRLHDIAQVLNLPITYFLPAGEYLQAALSAREWTVLSCFDRLSENQKDALLVILKGRD